MINQRIRQHFQESAQLKLQAAEQLAEPIAQAVEIMFTALSNGNKILACGNGGSAADCQHFAAELVGSFERERLPLPALALTTDTSILPAVGNDYGFRDVYAKQVQAFGQSATCCWPCRHPAIRPTWSPPSKPRSSATCASLR